MEAATQPAQSAVHSQIIAFFNRHLVPIWCLYRSKGANELTQRKRSVIISAFVMSIGDEWFLITAGHVLDSVEPLFSRQDCDVIQCGLIDAQGCNARYKESIPFPLWESPCLVFGTDEDYDYAVIPLRPHYKSLLQANGVEPLTEQVWDLQPNRIDFCMLLGVPAETVKTDEDATQLSPVQYSTGLFTVKLLENRPAGIKERHAPRLYGEVSLKAVDAEGEALQSIEGTSGGPLFAFQMDSKRRLRYWLVGLQSSWDPSSRCIAACPTRALGDFIRQHCIDCLPWRVAHDTPGSYLGEESSSEKTGRH